MKVYKLCEIDGSGQLWSYLGPAFDNSIKYFEGVTSRPKNGFGPLAAFDTFENALTYARLEGINRSYGIDDTYQIRECEATKSYDSAIWRLSKSGFLHYGGTIPANTVLCNEITIGELMWSNYE